MGAIVSDDTIFNQIVSDKKCLEESQEAFVKGFEQFMLDETIKRLERDDRMWRGQPEPVEPKSPVAVVIDRCNSDPTHHLRGQLVIQ